MTYDSTIAKIHDRLTSELRDPLGDRPCRHNSAARAVLESDLADIIGGDLVGYEDSEISDRLVEIASAVTQSDLRHDARVSSWESDELDNAAAAGIILAAWYRHLDPVLDALVGAGEICRPGDMDCQDAERDRRLARRADALLKKIHEFAGDTATSSGPAHSGATLPDRPEEGWEFLLGGEVTALLRKIGV